MKPGDPKADDKKDMKEDDDDLPPALGGPKEKVDPRFARKQRPVDKKPKPGDAKDQRADLQDRQEQNLHDLDSAQKSLKSDAETLAQLLNQLRQQMNGQQGKPTQGGQEPNDLKSLLASEAMQQAMAMAQRMKQGANQAQRRPAQPPPGSTMPEGNMEGTPASARKVDEVLGKLDANTRALILNMRPKLREELLQGMRNEGPEGYRQFIQDYFKPD